MVSFNINYTVEDGEVIVVDRFKRAVVVSAKRKYMPVHCVYPKPKVCIKIS